MLQGSSAVRPTNGLWSSGGMSENCNICYIPQKRNKDDVLFHSYTVHQWYQTLYYPTNARNVKNVELLEHFKNKESCFNIFRVYNETIIREPQPVLS